MPASELQPARLLTGLMAGLVVGVGSSSPAGQFAFSPFGGRIAADELMAVDDGLALLLGLRG